MKYVIKELLIYILAPLIIGFIGAVFSDSSNIYRTLVKPVFAPPSIVFPIVWTILYILMGISSYRIYKSDDIDNDNALKIYIIQLLINGLWSAIFFNLGFYTFAFIWIILLIFVVIKMTKKFIKIDKIAGYLQLPYILWLVFAAFLNLCIAILN